MLYISVKKFLPSSKAFRFLFFFIGLIFLLIILRFIQVLAFVPSEINFQGKLTDSNGINVANGYYDFRVRIYDAPSSATPPTGGSVKESIDLTDIYVQNGIFNLKFSPSDSTLSSPTGEDRYIQVCFNSESDASPSQGYTTGSAGITICNTGANDVFDKAFSPRKKITSNPYSLMSKMLGSNLIQGDANGNLSVGGTSTLTGNVGIGNSPSGTNALQVTGSSYFTGALTATGIITTGTTKSSSYYIGPNKVLSTPGYQNTFIGINAGLVNNNNDTYISPSGYSNTFIGFNSGNANTVGDANTFLGSESGYFFQDGESNTFIGSGAGALTTIASKNTFIGDAAGNGNTTGIRNSYLGQGAAFNMTTGSYNVILGSQAGLSVVTGSYLSFLGYGSGSDLTSISNAGAIGTFAKVNQNQALTIGAESGSYMLNVGIADATPASLLTVGAGDKFQVNSTGNLIAVNGVTYSWPSTQSGASGYILTNNGSGTLSWSAPVTCTTCFINGGNSFGANSTLGNNDNYSLTFKTNNLDRISINNSGLVGINATPTSGVQLLVNGIISSPGAGGTSSQRFGVSTLASATETTAIGSNANALGSGDTTIGYNAYSGTSGLSRSTIIGAHANGGTREYNVLVGAGATATGTSPNTTGLGTSVYVRNNVQSTAVGYSAQADCVCAGGGYQFGNVVLGSTSKANETSYATALGYNTNVSTYGGIALGANNATTATKQFVVGGTYSSIANTYLGSGVTNTATSGYLESITTINGTGGSGADIYGTSLGLAGGKSTGTGVGGSLIFSTSPASAVSSSTANALVERMRILSTGNVGIGTNAPTSRLHVPWLSGDTSPTLLVGSSNASNNQIGLNISSYSNYGINVSSNTTAAINVTSNSGSGIDAVSTSGYGLRGISGSGVGVSGVSTSNTGVNAQSTNGNGLYAVSSTSNAIAADSSSGYGVTASSVNTGVGLFRVLGANTANNSTAAFSILRSTSGAFNVTGDLLRVNDSATNSGTIGGNLLTLSKNASNVFTVGNTGLVGVNGTSSTRRLYVNGTTLMGNNVATYTDTFYATNVFSNVLANNHINSTQRGVFNKTNFTGTTTASTINDGVYNEINITSTSINPSATDTIAYTASTSRANFSGGGTKNTVYGQSSIGVNLSPSATGSVSYLNGATAWAATPLTGSQTITQSSFDITVGGTNGPSVANIIGLNIWMPGVDGGATTTSDTLVRISTAADQPTHSGIYNIYSESTRQSYFAGNIGIGDTTPASLLTVGSGDKFQVNTNGNIIKINNITYSWPSVQAAGAGYVLSNNGSGTLTWSTAAAGTVTGTGTQNYITKWDVEGTGIVNSMIIDDGTNVGIGASPTYKFDVNGGQTRLGVSTQYTERLCHNGTDGSTPQNVVLGDCNASGQADYAEYYGSNDASLAAGDIVAIDTTREAIEIDHPTLGHTSKAWVNKASTQNNVIGIVSTNPFVEVLGEGVFSESENPRPIALNGRVPVKVNTSNGDIKKGDMITLSSTTGVGMKATSAGFVVGKALSNYSNSDINTVGTILVFISNTYYNPSPTSTTTVSTDWTLTGSDLSTSSNVIINGSLNAQQIRSTSLFSDSININGGKFTVSSNGDVVSQGSLSSNSITATLISTTNATIKTLKVEKLSINQTPTTGDATIGTGTITAGEQTVVINNTNITAGSKIFLSITSDAGDNIRVINKIENVSFTVKLNTINTEDVSFDYWIIGN